MYLQLIVSTVFVHFLSAADLNHIPNKDDQEDKTLMGSSGRTNTTPYNITYIDRAENLIRLPAMNKFEEKKSKRKTNKKTPKRTIQKIIKKNSRSKVKKMYVMKMTSSATMMPKYDIDNDQDDYSIRNGKNGEKSEVTTRPNQQKKIKKYSVKQVKLPRYPMPYRKMQIRKINYKRPKREDRDIFILKDFDSMQFLKGKKDDDNDDYNIVNAHIKNYW